MKGINNNIRVQVNPVAAADIIGKSILIVIIIGFFVSGTPGITFAGAYFNQRSFKNRFCIGDPGSKAVQKPG